jgi:hypothetical protein
MRTTLSPLIAVVALFSFLAVAAALDRRESAIVFEDRFERDSLAAGWHWQRENRDGWRLRDGRLEIRVEPGRGETAKNVLWRDAPDRAKGPHAFEVTVTNLAPRTAQWEQAGMILYRGGVPVVKLVKELVDGKRVIVPGEVPMEDETVRLRLVIKGDEYVAQYQPGARGAFKTAAAGHIVDGRDIPAAGKLSVTEGDQVSAQCFEGPPDAEHWFRFDDFRITKVDALPEAGD